MIYDEAYTVQQTSRYRRGTFLIFNGQSGIWRKSCLDDVSGFPITTITEDMHISYMIQTKGWRIVFRHDSTVLGELPETVGAWLSQQYRWAKGHAQVAPKVVREIMKCPLEVSLKMLALVDILKDFSFILLFIILTMMPVVIEAARIVKPSWLEALTISLIMGTLLAGTLLAHMVSFMACKQSRWNILFMFPVMLMVQSGMVVNQCAAVIEGLISNEVTFVVRKKKGSGTVGSSVGSGNQTLCLLTLLLAGYYNAALIIQWNKLEFFVIPVYILVAAGTTIVGLQFFNQVWDMSCGLRIFADENDKDEVDESEQGDTSSQVAITVAPGPTRSICSDASYAASMRSAPVRSGVVRPDLVRTASSVRSVPVRSNTLQSSQRRRSLAAPGSYDTYRPARVGHPSRVHKRSQSSRSTPKPGPYDAMRQRSARRSKDALSRSRSSHSISRQPRYDARRSEYYTMMLAKEEQNRMRSGYPRRRTREALTRSRSAVYYDRSQLSPVRFHTPTIREDDWSVSEENQSYRAPTPLARQKIFTESSARPMPGQDEELSQSPRCSRDDSALLSEALESFGLLFPAMAFHLDRIHESEEQREAAEIDGRNHSFDEIIDRDHLATHQIRSEVRHLVGRTLSSVDTGSESYQEFLRSLDTDMVEVLDLHRLFMSRESDRATRSSGLSKDD